MKVDEMLVKTLCETTLLTFTQVLLVISFRSLNNELEKLFSHYVRRRLL